MYGGDGTTGLIVQLVPFFIFALIWAIPVYQIARKQKWNGWLWVILILIPVVGYLALFVLLTRTWMSTLDRLNKLEAEHPFK